MARKPLQSLAKGRYLHLVDDNGWEYVQRTNTNGVVAIVPLLAGNSVVLVDQYRIPLDKRVIEFPAGLAGDTADTAGEDLSIAASRELEEETGYRAAQWTFLTEGPPSAGLTSELITFYLARDLERIGPGGGDDSEDIICHEVALTEIDAWLRAKEKEGYIIDPKVYTGLYFLRHLIPGQG